MKHYMLLLIFCLSCLFVVAEELSEDEMEHLEDSVKIGSVSDDTVEEDDVEYLQLKFYTYQNEDDEEEYTFYVKVTVEVTDKASKDVYYTQFARTQGEVDSEYNGEDNWQFVVPLGELKKPKVTAYVVQYGVLVDKKFIILTEEADDVDTLEELTARTPTRLDQKPRILHQYSFRNSDQEIEQSGWN